MIRGNTDSSLLRYDAGLAPASWGVSGQFALMRWSHRHVDRASIELLRSLPEQGVFRARDAAHIRVVHGSPRDPAESIYPDRDVSALDRALDQTAEPVFVCGHTHQPWRRVRRNRLALNPGSVCGPPDGYLGAQYALLAWQDAHWEAELRGVRYDLGRVRRAFHESGLLAEGGPLARAFLLSIETGRDIPADFLAYAPSLAAQAGYVGCDVVPDPIWQRAGETFGWETAATGRLQHCTR